jgi:hypothetical protein
MLQIPLPRPSLSVVGIALVALFTMGDPRSAPLLDEQTKQLFVNAVEAAFEIDLFYNRCRSDRSGRRTENLNKELASRYRMTIIDVEDDLFPEGYYRDAESRMQRDFLERLRVMGGCAGAKVERLRDDLRERYDAAMAEIAAKL